MRRRPAVCGRFGVATRGHPEVQESGERGNPARGWWWGLFVCVPLLSGYVQSPGQLVQRWVRGTHRPVVALPALVPVRWQGRLGQLYLDRSSAYAVAVEGMPLAAADQRDRFSALWRALDLLLAPDPEGVAAQLAAADVDLERSGYARDSCSSDGVVVTVGARGEGEAELPQVWFGRNPLALCRVRLDGGAVSLGPPAAGGWPAWFRLAGGELLEVAGAPVPSLVRPSWAVPAAPLAPFSPEPLGDWRRAFDPPRL